MLIRCIKTKTKHHFLNNRKLILGELFFPPKPKTMFHNNYIMLESFVWWVKQFNQYLPDREREKKNRQRYYESRFDIFHYILHPIEKKRWIKNVLFFLFSSAICLRSFFLCVSHYWMRLSSFERKMFVFFSNSLKHHKNASPS